MHLDRLLKDWNPRVKPLAHWFRPPSLDDINFGSFATPDYSTLRPCCNFPILSVDVISGLFDSVVATLSVRALSCCLRIIFRFSFSNWESSLNLCYFCQSSTSCYFPSYFFLLNTLLNGAIIIPASCSMTYEHNHMKVFRWQYIRYTLLKQKWYSSELSLLNMKTIHNPL